MSHMAFNPGMGNPANCSEPVGFILKIHGIRIQLDKEAKFRLTNRHETRRNKRAIPEIECLPSPINQVIMNTIVNATHAIGPERRRITVRTRDDDGSVEAADTGSGSGIPKEILSRIVGPFFTTKPVSKGTGVGLSLSYGIVQKHRGRIDVESELGKGPTFRITLPIQYSAQENQEEDHNMNNVSPQPVETLAPQPRILCVDDEPNILSSLRRLFRNHGYQVMTAEGGAAGLQMLETKSVDLVISDMRMPEMDGAHFLENVRARWPDTIRLLLTGYSDISSIVEAINRGEIYRYITKPWDDNDILLIVRHALERHALEKEKQRLEALTLQQNEELKTLNASLETKVQERTAALKDAHDSLLTANEKLKTSFLTSIKVFSGMIEMRGGSLAGHSRRVADLARRIAIKMGLDAQEVQEVFVAGLLHNIGKIGFSDELLGMPVSMMNGENLGLYRKHSLRGEQLLMPLEDLRGAARIVRSQMERFDGEGSPDRLSGFKIPVGARILALASDYDNLQIGTLAQRRIRADDAKALIQQGSGKRYDPQVVKAFVEAISGGADDAMQDAPVDLSDLRPGMILSRDLITADGLLLLSAGHLLDERLIKQIMDYEASVDVKLMVHIRQDRGES